MLGICQLKVRNRECDGWLGSIWHSTGQKEVPASLSSNTCLPPDWRNMNMSSSLSLSICCCCCCVFVTWINYKETEPVSLGPYWGYGVHVPVQSVAQSKAHSSVSNHASFPNPYLKSCECPFLSIHHKHLASHRLCKHNELKIRLWPSRLTQVH